jgi:hypothetical protein
MLFAAIGSRPVSTSLIFARVPSVSPVAEDEGNQNTVNTKQKEKKRRVIVRGACINSG